MPYARVDSPFRCPRCSKKMVAQYGQHESAGDLAEAHECLNCALVWQTRDKALLLPEAHDPGPWMTVEQIAERRQQHLDRPEFLLRQPGLRAIVEAWEVAS